MFPALVNCCTIDWFDEWPEEALLSVARDNLQELENVDLIKNIACMCFTIHQVKIIVMNRFFNNKNCGKMCCMNADKNELHDIIFLYTGRLCSSYITFLSSN